MMWNGYYLFAFWPARKEDAAACAGRLKRMVQSWAEIHPLLGHWYKQITEEAVEAAIDRGETPQTAKFARVPLFSMPPDDLELTRLVKAGVAMKDIPHVPWPELGFSVSGWNGFAAGQSVGFTMRAGAALSPRRSANSIELDLPALSDRTETLIAAAPLRSVLMAIVEAWQPGWATLMPKAYEAPSTATEKFARPWGGWMTYVSANAGADKITAPRSVSAERTVDGGLLMSATDQPFLLANPLQVAQADAIDAALAPVRE